MQLMFPRATIIDVRRHPLGCCFSCFKQLFARSLYFTYEQQELGLYYRDYVELMAHTDTVLPGRVHRVYYEQLVADPEGEVRALLEHCGLPFEAECLRFYENRRVVKPSAPSRYAARSAPTPWTSGATTSRGWAR